MILLMANHSPVNAEKGNVMHEICATVELSFYCLFITRQIRFVSNLWQKGNAGSEIQKLNITEAIKHFKVK